MLFCPPTIFLGLFSFTLGHGVSFGGIQHSCVNGCSAASCNFGVLIGEDEPTSFYSPISSSVPVILPPDVKDWPIGKDPGAGKDWRQKEKGTTEDEVVGCHHRHNRHESEQAPGVGDGQESLACCNPWGHKESDMTEWLNWTVLVFIVCMFAIVDISFVLRQLLLLLSCFSCVWLCATP